MSNQSLPGNPHVAAIDANLNDLHHWQSEQGDTDATRLTQALTAQVDATLALAFEQRTANLIATMHVFDLYEDTKDLQGYVLEQIANRLGLDEV